MKSVYKRILCALLVLLMLPLSLTEGAVPVQAAYENTYANTGNQRKDIIGVAMTQVGYREENGRTKYGEWYGHPTVDWCAVFVAWCANQAGIPTSIIKKQGWANPASFGWKAYPASQRLPQPGDIYFKGSGTHTGIVIEVKQKTFVTVEGNTWLNSDTQPRVMIREWDLYNDYFTFASPNYQNDTGTSGCTHSYETGNETAHPHNEYKKCTLCGYKYYTGNSIALTNCTDCKQANCSHDYGAWSNLDGTYHRQICSKCNKINKVKHTWGNDKIIKEATCSDPGKKTQTCSVCNATKEVEIPATDRHEYTECLFVDQESHVIKCESCDRNIEKKHTLSGWNLDALTHWKECKDCGGRVSIENHTLEDGCESECSVCSEKPNTAHMYTSLWREDDISHWQSCLYCTDTRGHEEHQFTADCDDTCDVCSFAREAEHIYTQELYGDMNGHWQQCEICGQGNEIQPHTPGDAATEESPQKCTQCGFVITPKLIHKHVYTYTTDERTHSGVCACGEVEETAGHLWDMETGKCEICQMDVPPKPRQMLFNLIPLPNIEEQPLVWLIVSVSLAAVMLIVAIVLLIISIRRSLKIAAAEKLLEELAEDDENEEDGELDGIEPEEAVPIPIPDEPETVPIAETQSEIEELLHRVAEIEGVSYEESIAESIPEEMPQLEEPEKELAGAL